MLIALLLALSAHSQQVVDTNRELIDALARGDKAVVERVYADRFVRVSTSGELLTRAQLLAAVKPPAAGDTLAFDMEEVQVFDYGEAAVLTYVSVKRATTGGVASETRYRVTDTFVRKGGRWVKAASAGTPIPALERGRPAR
ncbi:MAG TPA: nuclear transport factor 2 family protein [Thermoanaerobaculia bacterium]|nr:nuclear transport factor 2 family protein [Thermoanaerobaculia bacterium]